jgi:hypothetical protein
MNPFYRTYLTLFLCHPSFYPLGYLAFVAAHDRSAERRRAARDARSVRLANVGSC